MARVIELIRGGTAPQAILRSAARGALSVTAMETLEILVFLATEEEGDEWVGVEARQTLAKWDEASTRNVLSNPGTSDEVLNFYCDMENFREAFLPALAANPSVSDDMLIRLAARAPSGLLSKMLVQQRILASSPVLNAIRLNLELTPEDENLVHSALVKLGQEKPREEPASEEKAAEPEGTVVDHDMDAALDAMVALAAEAAKRPDPDEQLTSRLKLAARRLRGQ